MLLYKIKRLGVILVVCFGFLSVANIGFADDTAFVGSDYSGKSGANIGAWYDESWEATGFYRLTEIGGSKTYRYEYTSSPTTASNPTFTEGEAVENDTEQVDGHEHKYLTTGVSLPQDTVITEWKATGHVHFPSGM